VNICEYKMTATISAVSGLSGLRQMSLVNVKNAACDFSVVFVSLPKMHQYSSLLVLFVNAVVLHKYVPISNEHGSII